jgi:hypothetical protein
MKPVKMRARAARALIIVAVAAVKPAPKAQGAATRWFGQSSAGCLFETWMSPRAINGLARKLPATRRASVQSPSLGPLSQTRASGDRRHHEIFDFAT